MAGALGYTLILYFFNKKSELSSKSKIWLSVIRFLVVFILGILIFAPLIKSLKTEIGKPTLAFLIDNSQSIGVKQDTAQLIKEWQNKIEFTKQQLANDFNVEFFTFGDKLQRNGRIDFSEKLTNLSFPINEAGRLYKHKNLGMIILASDGIYNRGSNPLYSAEKLGVPIATIGFGDTNQGKDLRIGRLAHNEFAFKGDNYPIEAEFEGIKCNGEKSRVDLLANGKVIQSRDLNFSSNNQVQKFSFTVKAETAGIVKHELRLQNIEGEVNKVNNHREFFIEIFETKRKILLVNDGSSPDIGALKRVINSAKNYEFTQKNIAEVSMIKDYDLVIFNDLLQSTNYITRIQNFLLTNTPCLIIAGGQTDPNAFNSLKLGISIQSTKKMSNEVTPVLNGNFTLFQLEDKLKNRVSEYPPINSPFGKYNLSADIEILLYQKIGNITTGYPLIAMTKTRNIPVGFIMGNGFWRWSMHENLRFQDQQTFDLIISQTIKYLSININRSRFDVKNKNIFDENEAVIFDATIYDKTFEPVKNADIKLDITDTAGKVFNYAFSKNGTKYFLDAGQFAPGSYSFKSTVKIGDSIFTDKGTFFVKSLELEFSNITANHNLLRLIANNHGSKLYNFSEFDALINDVKNRDDIRSIEYSHFNYSDLIDLKWILALLILLLTIEWFSRKYLGAY